MSKKDNSILLMNAIQDNDQNMLEEIREIRNNYTHLWDINNTQDKGNAKKLKFFKQYKKI